MSFKILGLAKVIGLIGPNGAGLKVPGTHITLESLASIALTSHGKVIFRE